MFVIELGHKGGTEQEACKSDLLLSFHEMVTFFIVIFLILFCSQVIFVGSSLIYASDLCYLFAHENLIFVIGR